jgi:uncharacterized damage-inducible protein DinB
MTTGELFADAFGRVREVVCDVVDGLSSDELAWRVDADANSIAWLVWHLTRIQDDHVAAVAGVDQAWTSSGWAQRFALPFDVADTGYGHSSAEIAAVVTDAEALRGYHEAVYENTLRFVGQLVDGDLDRIVDERWDPPVTMGVRLVSVITDDLQHAGQAAFVRGLLERR